MSITDMTRITESSIEEFTIELLEKQEYQYIYFSRIVSYSEETMP